MEAYSRAQATEHVFRKRGRGIRFRSLLQVWQSCGFFYDNKAHEPCMPLSFLGSDETCSSGKEPCGLLVSMFSKSEIVEVAVPPEQPQPPSPSSPSRAGC